MMKRMLAMMLALMLCLSGVAALAAETEEGLVMVSFGDFTLELNPETPIEGAEEMLSPDFEKTENAAFFTLRCAVPVNGDGYPSLSAVWNSAVQDFTEIYAEPEDLVELGEDTLSVDMDAYEAAGYAVSEASLLGAFMDTLDGRDCVVIVYAVTLDGESLSMDEDMTVYKKLVMVSSQDVGTYYFTLSSTDEETLSDILDPVLNSLHWQ